MYVEWLTIVGTAQERRTVAAGIAALVVFSLCLALGYGAFSLVVLLIGAAAVSDVATVAALVSRWISVMWGGCPFAAVQVRLDGKYGFVALMFVLLVVWVTDIGGYFAGREIGGPNCGLASVRRRHGRVRQAVSSL